MIFSPTSQYALRALIYLATHEQSGPVLGRTIAESESIPKQFLSKILHNLRNKGLIRSTMGPGGGYQLARPASEITVLQVVVAVEGPLNLEEVCVLGLDKCDDKEHCALHDQWKAFKERFISKITTMTLDSAGSVLIRKRKNSPKRKKK